ncbi:hypothetical protein MNBD_UNCLBAC01-508 [hydrothermal vent metagenome]|uniref:Uncharacterized protein n=1 Tax=hydrothermal vent metagenome TaxID=652676 RepID=A0A3B1DUW3_9ZZZZ
MLRERGYVVGGSFTAGRAKPGFTSVIDFESMLAFWAFKDMATKNTGSANKELDDIKNDPKSYEFTTF